MKLSIVHEEICGMEVYCKARGKFFIACFKDVFVLDLSTDACCSTNFSKVCSNIGISLYICLLKIFNISRSTESVENPDVYVQLRYVPMLQLQKPDKSQNSVSGTASLTFVYFLKLLLPAACPTRGSVSNADQLEMTELACAKLLSAANKHC